MSALVTSGELWIAFNRLVIDKISDWQHNEKAWKHWHQDVKSNLKKADANWPNFSQQQAPAPEAPAK
jgi:hypothetical protein